MSDQIMRRVGLEPTRPFGQGLLRAPRLPFRHRRTMPDLCEDNRAAQAGCGDASG